MKPSPSVSRTEDKEDSTCTSSCFGISIICKTIKSKLIKRNKEKDKALENGNIYIT